MAWLIGGQYHFVNGPTGPKHKNLGRTKVCQNEDLCVVQPDLTQQPPGQQGGRRLGHGDGVGGEDGLDGEGGVVVEFGDARRKQVFFS